MEEFKADDTPIGDEEFLRRYQQFGHAVQTGVAHKLALEYPGLDPSFGAGRYMKHLRTGIDMRAADHMALVRLLIAKGVIAGDEYKNAVLAEAKREKERYEAELTALFRRQPGANPELVITLD